MKHSSEQNEFSVQWLIPTTLEKDHDLIDEEGGGEQHFNDNLGIQITGNGLDFIVFKRHLITFCGAVATILPQDNWDWDEHGELNEQECKALDVVLSAHNGQIVPNKEYAQQLRLEFQTH